MALVKPVSIGLARTWELASTPISSTIDSDVAEGGLSHFLGTIYVITSGTVAMTVQIQESPDNINWVIVDENVIDGNEAYRIVQPFPYLKLTVSAWTSGVIESITLFGMIQ